MHHDACRCHEKFTPWARVTSSSPRPRADGGTTSPQTVSAIDLATNPVSANWSVGYDPTSLALDPATHTLYVASPIAGSVSVIHPKR